MSNRIDEAIPLIKRAHAAVPSGTATSGVKTPDSPTMTRSDTVIPEPTFARATSNEQKRPVPQCIAHRGYKAKFPENSMLGFREAVKAGAEALETDIHLTKDEVVVLSHDASLKRCFGRQDKLLDCEWDQIKDLRTLAAPHVPMPTLKELLESLNEPEMEHVWILLDIKLDNDADNVMRLIAKTIAEVKPAPNRRWQDRVVLGVWVAKFVPFGLKYSPGFPMVHIGASLSHARHFFTIPKIGFNMLMPVLLGPGGRRFIRDCQEKEKRVIIAWTVNVVGLMQWCIRKKLDGVITDDPAKFIEVRKKFDEKAKDERIPLRTFIDLVRMWIFISVMLVFFKRYMRPVASPALINKAKE